jgi:6-phosphogluconolactonase
MIQVYSDLEEMSRAAAALFVDCARRAVRARGRFSVALSGGSTPQHCYELLAAPPLSEQVPWESVHVFWGDERCVPPTDSRSNLRMARQSLLNHVPVPGGAIHPMECAADPQGAADAYEQTLREHFGTAPPRFDLVLLGLGADGHTASLFPGGEALGETERWVVPAQLAGQDFRRLTLTLPLLNQTHLALFLVAGAEKASILARILEPPAASPALPAERIAPAGGEVLWLVDQAAFDGLKDRG